MDRAHRRFVCLHMYTCTYSLKREFTAVDRTCRLQTLQGCSKGRPGSGRLRNQTMVGSFHAYIRTHVYACVHICAHISVPFASHLGPRGVPRCERPPQRLCSEPHSSTELPARLSCLSPSWDSLATTRAWRERVREINPDHELDFVTKSPPENS